MTDFDAVWCVFWILLSFIKWENAKCPFQTFRCDLCICNDYRGIFFDKRISVIFKLKNLMKYSRISTTRISLVFINWFQRKKSHAIRWFFFRCSDVIFKRLYSDFQKIFSLKRFCFTGGNIVNIVASRQFKVCLSVLAINQVEKK